MPCIRLGTLMSSQFRPLPTQIDLPASKRSGLLEAMRALQDVEGISLIQFEKRDVVRHPLVQRIVGAYERHRGTGQPGV